MLIRISLIVAIIAGLAVGAVNYVYVKQKITQLQADLAEQTEGRRVAEADLAKTRKTLAATTAELKTTKETLETTTQERDSAVAEAARRTKEAEQLTTDLKRVTGERDDAQAEVARYRVAGMTPEQVAAAAKTIKDLQTSLAGVQGENRVLLQVKRNLQNELDHYKSPEKIVPLPASIRGKVLVADPKWNFVIVNVGEDQGVLPYGELLVNRNGKLVGKVIVRNVQKDRSIANLMPGWEIGEVLEGDQVIPAHPSAS
jgi:Tfp pilus assembly protein PilE